MAVAAKSPMRMRYCRRNSCAASSACRPRSTWRVDGAIMNAYETHVLARRRPRGRNARRLRLLDHGIVLGLVAVGGAPGPQRPNGPRAARTDRPAARYR